MAIKNILVAYNGSKASDAAVRMGLLMAGKYDAHLTGVLAHGMPQVLSSAGPWLTERLSEQLSEIIERTKAEIYEGISARFNELAAASNRTGKCHWHDIYGSADATIAEIARRFDITLIGEFSVIPGEEQVMLRPDIVALQSGRPVMIVPADYEVAELQEHAVLAWDGKRAAARALSDAMLILETKTLVTVLTIGHDGPEREITGVNISAHLDRHGIKTEFVKLPRNGSVGTMITGFCRERDVGLLVMGAYEHSKFSEDLIGGVTNDVLKTTTVPVLMSH
jgi:nucleotide-binding universal stress UspA family protein